MAARAALLLWLALLPLPARNLSTQPFAARVVSVADGDTLTVLYNRQQIRIRLYGIDCPEPGQPFHRRAMQRTGELVHGRTVTVRPESGDRYGRLVAWILLPDGRSLNEILVAEGLAWHYRRYAPREKRLARLEEEARDARRGLWQDPRPVPPWEWRRASRRSGGNITPQVEQCLRESGIREGLCLVNAMHITASVFINDDEPGLHHDYDVWLEKLAPHEPVSAYRHNRTGEDNADAHMKRQIMGREVVVAVTGGRLDFGPWEQIFYGEFDGRRRKRVLVKIIGE